MLLITCCANLFLAPANIVFLVLLGISNKVLLGMSDGINSDNLLSCMIRSTATKVIAHTVTRSNIYLVFPT